MNCDHAPSDNPRHRDTCRKCGIPMPQPQRRPRNPQFEQQITRELAAGLNVDVEPLIVFSQWRADKAETEYGKGFPDESRDLVREATEEAADLRNYIVWKLEQIHRTGDESAATGPLQSAMRYLILAFEELRHAL